MFLNPSLGFDSPELFQVHPENNKFDFVVANRPKYIPGSGPPLAPISIMPDREKDGIIVASFDVNHLPRYVVSYADKPYLRMSVAPENILDYVSRHTFETYEYTQTLERDGYGKGKGSKGAIDTSGRRDEQPKQKGKRSRKRKHPLVEADDKGHTETSNFRVMIGPSSRAAQHSIQEPEPVFTSPQRPTLTSPSKQRGLADMVESETEDEEELPTDIAIEAQLNNTMQSYPKSKLHMKVSLSPSPAPSSATKRKHKDLSPISRIGRSPSRKTRSSRSQSASVSRSANKAKLQRRSVRNVSVATTSSLEAGKIYDKLERVKSKTKTPSKKPSHFAQYSSLARAKELASSAPQDDIDMEDVEGDEDLSDGEYEVEAILDERQVQARKKKDKRINTEYLIKWVGDWPLTWEPSEIVGNNSIVEYERKKNLGLIAVGVAGAAFHDAEEVAPLAFERSKKNKRYVIDESDGNRARKETRGLAFTYKQPSQGQVIDDDDSDYDSN